MRLIFPLLWPLLAAGQILQLEHSPQARVGSLPLSAVRMGEGFWTKRRNAAIGTSMPALLRSMEENGWLDNFRRLSGAVNKPRRGPQYTDSDLYKWMEAAAWVLASGDRGQLRQTLENAAATVIAAQEPDGYLNTYYARENLALRYVEMQRSHELYCLGHLLQAAIALHRANGDARLLDAGIRFANHFVERFGRDRRPALAGHPNLEMAMVELYRVKRDRRYLDFAGYLLEGDGRYPLSEKVRTSDTEYVFGFMGRPFTSRTKMEMHTVQALYAACGATDYYLETGDPDYRRTLDTLWRDLTETKMYLHGGAGSRVKGESIGEAYELPNRDAYAESCAAIANVMWNWRLLAATGDARYTDVLERALYNNVNSGLSLDGATFCYRNPLEYDGGPIRNPHGERRIRLPWLQTACCPSNLQRTFAALPGYLYGVSREGVWVHLFHNSELAVRLDGGTPLKLTQKTNYPWNGRVELAIAPARPAAFTLFVRIPGWSRSPALSLNGKRAAARPGAYAALNRTWKSGDRVVLDLDVVPRWIEPHPKVKENAGKLALQRGPLVYCLEQPDQRSPVFDIKLARGRLRSEYRPDLLGGVVVVRQAGAVFTPYYTFANRGPAAMRVWIPAGR
ncbi:MAG: glycoside hydrolase family 127 protein [Bryobacteraceae bacterium]